MIVQVKWKAGEILAFRPIFRFVSKTVKDTAMGTRCDLSNNAIFSDFERPF